MEPIAIAVLILVLLALLAGLLLGIAAQQLPASGDELSERINELLPQTQCAQCGYAGCRPYAQAVASGDADINLCPPGGDATVRQLAELLGREALPLARVAPPGRQVAVIDAGLCIGCLHCRNACPVDAIIGARHKLPTIIEQECTGCELCIAPCPVACITLRAAT